jgi:hypothetical protein
MAGMTYQLERKIAMNTIEFAVHTVYLDPVTGQGLLVVGLPEDDLSLGGVSLHEADWNHAIAELDRLGWEPTEDDEDEEVGVCYDGDTLDGRAVIGLYGREPITPMASIRECGMASQELMRLAGLTV